MDVSAFVSKFADPKAGRSGFDRAMDALASGLMAFGKSYSLGQQAKAAVAERQQDLEIELRKLAQKDRELDIDQYTAQSLDQNRRVTAETAAQNTESLITRRGVQNQADLGGLEVDRSAEERRARQGDARIDLTRRDQDMRDRQFNTNDATRRYLHNTPSGSVIHAQGAIADRAGQRSGSIFADMLVRNGVIASPFNQDGTLNPQAAKTYNLASQIGGAQNEEERNALIQQAMQEQNAQEQSQIDVQGMRREAIGAMGQDKSVRNRIENLDQLQGGQVSFQDIYQAPASQVIGAKDDIPTLYLDPEAQRRQEAGGFVSPKERVLPEMDLEFLRQTMEFLNRQSEANLDAQKRSRASQNKVRQSARDSSTRNRPEP